MHKWQNLAKYGHIEGNFQPNQAGSRRRKRVCQNHNQIEEKAKAKKVLNSNFGILNRIIELQSVPTTNNNVKHKIIIFEAFLKKWSRKRRKISYFLRVNEAKIARIIKKVAVLVISQVLYFVFKFSIWSRYKALFKDKNIFAKRPLAGTQDYKTLYDRNLNL